MVYYYDDDGMLVIKTRLQPETGAVVLKALMAAVDSIREADREAVGEPPLDETKYNAAVLADLADGDYETLARRRADAWVQIAESYLASGPRAMSSAERYQIMVHVSAETLDSGGPGRGELEHGSNFGIDMIRRLTCDGSIVVIAEDEDGEPLNIGGKSRAIPPAMHRALRSRDQGCWFPGCTHKHTVDAHHIQPWSEGGETKAHGCARAAEAHGLGAIVSSPSPHGARRRCPT